MFNPNINGELNKSQFKIKKTINFTFFMVIFQMEQERIMRIGKLKTENRKELFYLQMITILNDKMNNFNIFGINCFRKFKFL